MEYFTQVTALATLAVVVVQQILKLNVVPVYFANRFPVLTNVVLSVLAAVVVTWQSALNLVGLWQWVAYVGTLSVLAAVTYNMTLAHSPAVQRVSSAKSKSDVA